MPGGLAAGGEEVASTLGAAVLLVSAHMRNLLKWALLLVGAVSGPGAQSASAQQHSRDAQIHDADTLRWWHTTEALSGDAMEGRDTGTAAYLRAAEVVAGRFKAAGLMPAGDDGTYFQRADA